MHIENSYYTAKVHIRMRPHGTYQHTYFNITTSHQLAMTRQFSATIQSEAINMTSTRVWWRTSTQNGFAWNDTRPQCLRILHSYLMCIPTTTMSWGSFEHANLKRILRISCSKGWDNGTNGIIKSSNQPVEPTCELHAVLIWWKRHEDFGVIIGSR